MELKIVNVFGEEVYFEKLDQFKGPYLKQIDLSTYSTGVYNLHLSVRQAGLLSSEGTINKKLIVE